MVDLLFGAMVIIIGLPMIIAPKKITEREKSKIKSEMGVRIIGIIIVVLGPVSMYIY